MPVPNGSLAWTQLLDPQGFFSDFGTTKVGRRSRWFMYQAASGFRDIIWHKDFLWHKDFRERIEVDLKDANLA
jgi:hypothetical protein